MSLLVDPATETQSSKFTQFLAALAMQAEGLRPALNDESGYFWTYTYNHESVTLWVIDK